MVQSKSQRLISLDVFRGATIIGMIIVNNPGTWAHVYGPLLHADWHGWTPTDLVFPFFLFIVGVAIAIAFTKRLERGVAKGDLAPKIVRRAAILFGLGLLMAAWPFFTFSPEFGLAHQVTRIRIMGVLQRIALCYLIASFLFLYTTPKGRQWWLVGLLLVYWMAMALIPVPGYGAGLLDDPVGNLASYLDRVLLGRHLWSGADYMRDPEGLFSTLPAIATTLFGIWTGTLLIDKNREPLEKAAVLFARGVALVIIGYVWDWFFPINKPIWTSSYAVFTAGQAMCTLALCYWLIDIKGYKGWTKPFVIYGVNALVVYVASGLLARTFYVISVGDTSLQSWLFATVFAPLAPLKFASLLYAIVWVLCWYAVLYVMHKRNIIIKV